MTTTAPAEVGEGEVMDIADRFEKFEDEYIKFDRIENKRSGRPDLHAFLLLDELVPGTFDIVSAAEHDEIYLDVSPNVLDANATDDQIRDLVRCGVTYDDYTESLRMGV